MSMSIEFENVHCREQAAQVMAEAFAFQCVCFSGSAKHHDQQYVSYCRRPSFREIVDVLRRLSPGGQAGLGDPSDQRPTF